MLLVKRVQRILHNILDKPSVRELSCARFLINHDATVLVAVASKNAILGIAYSTALNLANNRRFIEDSFQIPTGL